jgi:hypothetical protein
MQRWYDTHMAFADGEVLIPSLTSGETLLLAISLLFSLEADAFKVDDLVGG